MQPDDVRGIRVTTPASSLQPLIHSAPTTGLEGKFSLEYGIAAAVLDGRPGPESFTDEAVLRPEAQRIIKLVEVVPTEGDNGLLDEEVKVEIALERGEQLKSSLKLPPGAPDRPPSPEELARKVEACAGGHAEQIMDLTWDNAAAVLRRI